MLVPSRDTQWVIGVIVAAVIILSTQNAGVHRRIDDLHQRIDGVHRRIDDLAAVVSGLRADLAEIDDRLRAVAIAFGKVDQRLATIERIVLPASPD